GIDDSDGTETVDGQTTEGTDDGDGTETVDGQTTEGTDDGDETETVDGQTTEETGDGDGTETVDGQTTEGTDDGDETETVDGQTTEETGDGDGTETVDGQTTEGTDDGDGTETVDGQTTEETGDGDGTETVDGQTTEGIDEGDGTETVDGQTTEGSDDGDGTETVDGQKRDETSTGGENLPSEVDNSGESHSGSQPSALSELSPPEKGQTFSDILAGKTNEKKETKITRRKRPDPTTTWTVEELAELDHERALTLTGLEPHELRIYNEWKRILPEQLVRETKIAFSAFLKKYLGMQFRPTDDLSQEWVDIVNIALAQGGTAKITKKKPFPVKISFLLDKSGSMGMVPDRIFWARLMIMLFLEVIVDLNEEYEGLFRWETIVYDEAIERITSFKESERVRRYHKSRVVYDTLTALDPSGWTDDTRAFATAIDSQLQEVSKDDGPGIHIVLAIGDGNFGTNPEISEKLTKAEQKDVFVRVISVGDDAANQSTVDTCGQKCSILPPRGDFSRLPRLCWESFLEILEEVTGQPVRDMATYLGEKTHDEVNPQLKRIFSQLRTKDFYFLQGWKKESTSEEGHVGSLFDHVGLIEADRIDDIFLEDESFDIESLVIGDEEKQLFRRLEDSELYYFDPLISEEDFRGHPHEKALRVLFQKYQNDRGMKKRYAEMLLHSLRDLKSFIPGIEEFHIVLVNNVDFSGHSSYKRGGRIYIPLGFLKLCDEYPELAHEMLSDFIAHEYLECLLERFEKVPADELTFTREEEHLLYELLEIKDRAKEPVSIHECVVAYLKERDIAESRADEEGKSVFERIQQRYSQQLRHTGYRHFFYERKNEKDYLVYRRGDIEYRWERGVGKINIPEKVTIDDDDNEQILLDILQSFYSQGEEYTSFSRDGRFYIRMRPDETVEVKLRGDDGMWFDEAILVFGDSMPSFHQEDGYKEYKKSDCVYRIDEQEKALTIKRGVQNLFKPVKTERRFSDKLDLQYSAQLDRWCLYDDEQKSVIVLKETEDAFIEEYYLKVDKLRDQKANRVLVLKGEPGLGKDELLQAAAHLIGEELWYLVGHEDATESDIVCRRVLTDEGSSYVYSSLNYVQNNGGIVVVSEGQYINEEAFGALKEAIASGKHERYIKQLEQELIEKSILQNEQLVRKSLQNHPRARIVMTTNIKRRGIKIEGFNDQAILDRFSNIHFVWKRPHEEIRLQYELAVEKLQKLLPNVSHDELEYEKERLLAIARGLLEVIWPLRLSFMGYNAQELAAFQEEEFARWPELLTDHTFEIGRTDAAGKMLTPRSSGELPRRAPSPRVIQQILQFGLAFPKTWEHTPWTVIELFFNFEANKMDEQERRQQMEFIKQRFSDRSYSFGEKQIPFKDKNDVIPVKLTRASFAWDEEGYLIVTPELVKTDENKPPVAYWDSIKIWVPESARGRLPDEVHKWLSTGNSKNQKLLYQMLQLRQLGMNILLIGDAGTGKSVLGRGICKLLSGPDLESYNLSQATQLSKLVQTPELDEHNVVYYQSGPVLRGGEHNKLVFIDELTQGRPGVQAGLNEVLQRKVIALFNQMVQGGDGFGFIFAANTPGGPFKVEAPSDEFIERCAILRVDPLSAGEIGEFLTEIESNLGERVNPRIIGNKKVIDSDTGEIEQIILDGKVEDRYFGLVGVFQYLRKELLDHPDEQLLRRLPGFRVFEMMIPHIADYWREPVTRQERLDPQFYQKQLWTIFIKFFEQAAKDHENMYAIEKLLKEAFMASGLWIERPEDPQAITRDGVLETLAGEDMVISQFPIIRKAKTGDEKTRRILDYIQSVTRGKGVEHFIDELIVRVDSLISSWETVINPTVEDRLYDIYELREIWQILHLIITERGQGEQLSQHLSYNYQKIIEIMQTIQSALIFDNGWPQSFLLYKAEKDEVQTYSEALEELLDRWGKLESTGDFSIDLLLAQIAINREDEAYLTKTIEKLTNLINERIISRFDGALLHEIIPELALLTNIYKRILEIGGSLLFSKSEILHDCEHSIETLLQNSPFSIEAQAAAYSDDEARINEFKKKMGFTKRKALHKVFFAVADRLFADTLTKKKREALLTLLEEYSSFFPEMYRYLIVEGMNQEKDSKREDYSKGAQQCYRIWQEVITYSEKKKLGERQEKLMADWQMMSSLKRAFAYLFSDRDAEKSLERIVDALTIIKTREEQLQPVVELLLRMLPTIHKEDSLQTSDEKRREERIQSHIKDYDLGETPQEKESLPDFALIEQLRHAAERFLRTGIAPVVLSAYRDLVAANKKAEEITSDPIYNEIYELLSRYIDPLDLSQIDLVIRSLNQILEDFKKQKDEALIEETKGVTENIKKDKKMRKKEIEKEKLEEASETMAGREALIRVLTWVLNLVYVMGEEWGEEEEHSQNDVEKRIKEITLTETLINDSEVLSTAISSDGRYIVSGSMDKTVKVWEIENGKQKGEPVVFQDKGRNLGEHSAWSVSFSPDGRYVVSGSGDGKIKVREIENGKQKGEPVVLQDRGGNAHSLSSVMSVSFSPDGRYIVSGSDDKTVKVWEIENGKQKGEPVVFQDKGRNLAEYSAWSVSFSPDGRYVVSGSMDKTVKVWEIENGKQKGEPVVLQDGQGNAHSHDVRSVSFSPDGRYIVSASRDKTVKVWEIENGKQKGEPVVLQDGQGNAHSHDVRSVSFSPDGRYIVSASRDKTVKVWEIENGKQKGEPVVLQDGQGNAHSHDVRSVSFSPDGRYIVSGSLDKTLKIWEIEWGEHGAESMEHRPLTKEEQVRLEMVKKAVKELIDTYKVSLKSLEEYRAFLLEHGEEKIRQFIKEESDEIRLVWDLMELLSRYHIDPLDIDQIDEVIRSFNEIVIPLLIEDDEQKREWKPLTEEEEAHQSKMQEVVRELIYTFNYSIESLERYREFLVLHGAKKIKKYIKENSDIITDVWSLICTFQRNKIDPLDLDQIDEVIRYFIAMSTPLPIGEEEEEDTAQNEKKRYTRVQTLKEHEEQRITSLALSPDGKQLVTADFSGTIKMWNLTDWSAGLALDIPGQNVLYSPDGTYLISSDDTTIFTYSLEKETAQQALLDPAICTSKTLRGFADPIKGLFISHDGEYIFGRSDFEVKCWNRQGNLLCTLSETDQHTSTQKNRIDGFTVSLDGNKVLTWNKDGRLTLYTITDKNAPGLTVTAIPVGAYGVEGKTPIFAQFSQDGSRVITATDKKIVVFTDELEIREVFTQHDLGMEESSFNHIMAMDVSPDGKIIVYGDVAGVVRRMNTDTREVVTLIDLRLEGETAGKSHEMHIRGVMFSSDGSRIISKCERERVKIWDAKTGELIGELVDEAFLEEERKSHKVFAWDIAYRSGAKQVLLARDNGVLEVWEEGTEKKRNIVHRTSYIEEEKKTQRKKPDWLVQLVKRVLEYIKDHADEIEAFVSGLGEEGEKQNIVLSTSDMDEEQADEAEKKQASEETKKLKKVRIIDYDVLEEVLLENKDATRYEIDEERRVI
ncbi:AAA family ATPase, partial [Chlamydiota bacterium]